MLFLVNIPNSTDLFIFLSIAGLSALLVGKNLIRNGYSLITLTSFVILEHSPVVTSLRLKAFFCFHTISISLVYSETGRSVLDKSMDYSIICSSVR